MKKIRTIIQTVLVMALVICMSTMPVMAQELTSSSDGIVTMAEVPSGYTLVATYSRTPQTYYLGTTSVRSTSTFQLYLPNEGNKDWIQGNVKFTGTGGTYQFDFTNLSGEYKTFDLSELTPGMYEVRVYAYAFGTSNKATAYYKMNY